MGILTYLETVPPAQHTATPWQSWDVTPGSQVREPTVSATTISCLSTAPPPKAQVLLYLHALALLFPRPEIASPPPDCPGQHAFPAQLSVLSSWVPSSHSAGQARGVAHGPWVSWPGHRGYKGLEARQGTSEMPSAGSGDPLDEGAAMEEGRSQHSIHPIHPQAGSTLC